MNREHRGQGLALFVLALVLGVNAQAVDRVRIDTGSLEGTASADSKVRIFKGIPLRGAARWPFTLESAPTCCALDRSPQSDRVWGALHARRHLLGHGFPRQRTQRRLLVPERVDARDISAARICP